MALFRTVLVVLALATTAALNVGSVGRRAVCQQAGAICAAAAAAGLPSTAAFAADAKDLNMVKDTSAALKKILETKQTFIDALGSGESVTLPPAIPFTTFQRIEKTSDPEFMEAAIDYAEAYRGVKDLVKLAKLTKEKVVLSTKEKGKPREETTMDYGDAPNSGLAPTKEYAERALNEMLGASLALDAAIGFMK